MNTMAQYLADAAAMECQLYVRDTLGVSEEAGLTAPEWNFELPELGTLLSGLLPKSLVSLFGLRIA